MFVVGITESHCLSVGWSGGLADGRSVPRIAIGSFNFQRIKMKLGDVSVHYTSRLFVSLEVFTRCAPFDFDINCTLVLLISATDS